MNWNITCLLKFRFQSIIYSIESLWVMFCFVYLPGRRKRESVSLTNYISYFNYKFKFNRL